MNLLSLSYIALATVVSMTLPRSRQIDPELTRYYHCTSRCVRRAFLCGKDHQTGRDFSHRRDWIEGRLQLLAEVFAIDLCSYAVMSNHYHVLLHLDPEGQRNWSDHDVLERWARIHHVPKDFGELDRQARTKILAEWRERLGSISWFMREVNERLARIANKEDGCKGRFWESRFSCQAVLDESGLLKCMAYVDLNPVRAGIAQTPEESEYTSIHARIHGQDSRLAPLQDPLVSGFTLPISKHDYISLVEWTGRQISRGKRGCIDSRLPPIIERLQHASRRRWLDEMRHLGRYYFRAIGNAASLRNYREQLGQTKLWGLSG